MTLFEITLFGITIAPTYYGLMYALGFICGYRIIKSRIFGAPILPFFGKNSKPQKSNTKLTNKEIKPGDYMDSLLFHIFFGVVIGGRLGYVLLYDFGSYLSAPLNILKVWEGGMSFHGGFLGVVIAMYIFSKRNTINFYGLADQIAAVVPIGIGLGRIGNVLNKELLGFSDYFGPLAVVVGKESYFPSPLLESFLEGAVLFIILNIAYRKKQFAGQIASLFLILYGTFRIFVEIFFRTPDAHIGYIFSGVSLGILYSLPMVFAGIFFYNYCKKQKGM